MPLGHAKEKQFPAVAWPTTLSHLQETLVEGLKNGHLNLNGKPGRVKNLFDTYMEVDSPGAKKRIRRLAPYLKA